MNTSAKGVLLAVATYIVTTGVAISIAVIAIIALQTASANCSDMGRALVVLWATIAAVYIASIFVYVALARKYVRGLTRRKVIAVAYAAALAVSYVVIAFGLMVLFNC